MGESFALEGKQEDVALQYKALILHKYTYNKNSMREIIQIIVKIEKIIKHITHT